MIVEASSPSRISLLGGGTDLPSFSDKFGGEVFNIAINLKTHIKLYTGDDVHQIADNFLPHTADPELFYKIRDKFHINSMHHSLFDSRFDGFIKSGLGSSGSAAVAMIGACLKATGKKMTKKEIAELAWKIEVEKLKWYGGRQDQYASIYGGGNLFRFSKGKAEREILERGTVERLCGFIQLYYLGGSRNSSTIQKGFKELTDKQIEYLKSIKFLVERGLFYLSQNDFEQFGEYIDKSWQMKKLSNENVTNDRIDFLYDLSMKNGAWGAKLCGAGQSGYFLVISDINKHEKIEQALLKENIERVDYEPDFQGLSVRIL